MHSSNRRRARRPTGDDVTAEAYTDPHGHYPVPHPPPLTPLQPYPQNTPLVNPYYGPFASPYNQPPGGGPSPYHHYDYYASNIARPTPLDSRYHHVPYDYYASRTAQPSHGIYDPPPPPIRSSEAEDDLFVPVNPWSSGSKPLPGRGKSPAPSRERRSRSPSRERRYGHFSSSPGRGRSRSGSWYSGSRHRRRTQYRYRERSYSRGRSPSRGQAPRRERSSSRGRSPRKERSSSRGRSPSRGRSHSRRSRSRSGRRLHSRRSPSPPLVIIPPSMHREYSRTSGRSQSRGRSRSVRQRSRTRSRLRSTTRSRSASHPRSSRRVVVVETHAGEIVAPYTGRSTSWVNWTPSPRPPSSTRHVQGAPEPIVVVCHSHRSRSRGRSDSRSRSPGSPRYSPAAPQTIVLPPSHSADPPQAIALPPPHEGAHEPIIVDCRRYRSQSWGRSDSRSRSPGSPRYSPTSPQTIALPPSHSADPPQAIALPPPHELCSLPSPVIALPPHHESPPMSPALGSSGRPFTKPQRAKWYPPSIPVRPLGRAQSPTRSQDTVSTSELHKEDELPTPVSHQGKQPSALSASWKALYASTPGALQKVTLFLGDTIPRQIYLHLLLRVPALYFTRITRVFEDAELSMRDIEQMRRSSEYAMLESVGPMGDHFYHSYPTLARFKLSWDEFVDSVTTEWQVQNVVSVLLLGAVLAELSIDSIESDPVTRTAALLSLVCALMSLLYGCIYMAQFGAMKKLYKAASWAEEAQRSRTDILWNVWVFLAMPTVWLLWSTLAFVASIISYTWRAGSTVDDPEPLSPGQAIIPRLIVSIVLFLGLLYLVCILRTLYRYGAKMENAWRANFRDWRRQARKMAYDPYFRFTDPYARKTPEPYRRPRSRSPRSPPRKTRYGRPRQHDERGPRWSPEGPQIPRGKPASQPDFHGTAEFPYGTDRDKRLPVPPSGSRGIGRGPQDNPGSNAERGPPRPFWPDEDGHQPDPDLAGLLGAADLRQLLVRPRDEPTLIAGRQLITSSRHESTSATRRLMITDGTIDDRAENTDEVQSIEDTDDSDTEPDLLASYLEHWIQYFATPTVNLAYPSVLDLLERPLGPFGHTLRNRMSGWIPNLFGAPPSTELSTRLPEKQYMVYAFHESILSLSFGRGPQLAELTRVGIDERDWIELFSILPLIWTGRFAVLNFSQKGSPARLDTIRDLILCYNTAAFHARGLELFLSSEPVTMDDAFATSASITIPEEARVEQGKFWVIFFRARPGEEGELDRA